MTYANDVTGAYAALTDLGHDADQVALSLTELGIRGKRKDAFCCPVAQLLKDLFPLSSPELNDGFVTFYGWLADSDVADMLAPDPVTDFALAFDRGAYPHLEVSNA